MGHQREVAHEDRLALDLTGVVVGELRRDVERSGVGEVLLLALVDGVLGVVEDRVLERERHRLGEVLDRRDLLEDLLVRPDLLETSSPLGEATLDAAVPLLVADQPVEAVGLESEELREPRAARRSSRTRCGRGKVVPAVLRAAKRRPSTGTLVNGADRPQPQPPDRRRAFEGRRNAPRYTHQRRATNPRAPGASRALPG